MLGEELEGTTPKAEVIERCGDVALKESGAWTKQPNYRAGLKSWKRRVVGMSNPNCRLPLLDLCLPHRGPEAC